MKRYATRSSTILLLLLLCAAACGGPRPVPRNVIVFVADGMGPQHLSLLYLYARYGTTAEKPLRDLAIKQMYDSGNMCLVMTEPYGNLVVDSACSATMFAGGGFARSEMIGLDKNGDPVETMLEKAKRLGKATGLVTNTRITHATPAAFAAHVPHRDMEARIAEQMLVLEVDVMLGGGLCYFLPEHVQSLAFKESNQELLARLPEYIRRQSRRTDRRDLLAEARAKGYRLAHTRQQMLQAPEGKLLGLFAHSAMPDALTMHNQAHDPGRRMPSLSEMAQTALNRLSQNDKGFFLMVEAGQIDYAGHDNDAGLLLHELLACEQAFACVWDWCKKHPDTLLLLLADHDTGSFAFSYSKAGIPPARSLPGRAFRQREFQPAFNYGNPDVLDKLYRQQISFAAMLSLFDNLPESEQTAPALAAIVNQYSRFTLSASQAERVLAAEANRFYREGHKYLCAPRVPRIDDFAEFYVYGDQVRRDLIGRALAPQQMVCWGTGTHTATPVVAVAYGPGACGLRGLLHMSDLGRWLMEAAGLAARE